MLCTHLLRSRPLSAALASLPPPMSQFAFKADPSVCAVQHNYFVQRSACAAAAELHCWCFPAACACCVCRE